LNEFLIPAEKYRYQAQTAHYLRYAVAFVDLDGLKRINDTLGHETGDRALIEAASVLKESFRQSDVLGRLSGDEFSVFISHTDENEASGIRQRVQQHLDTCNAQSGRQYSLCLSIGIVSGSSVDNVTIEALLKQADALMYEQNVPKPITKNTQPRPARKQKRQWPEED